MKTVVRFEDDCLSDEEADSLEGQFIGRDSFDLLLETEDANVFKPDGSLLLKFRKRVLSETSTVSAFPALLGAAKVTLNRGTAAGSERLGFVKKDGTVSNTTIAPAVNSGIVGFFDRQPRTPYCRTTAYTAEDLGRFRTAFPLIREVSDQFKAQVPTRWAAQNEIIQRTNPDFRIPDTVFTTITVNKNWQTAVHKDAGDLAAGFGVLTVLERGRFDGGYLVIPRYKVAIRIRERDLLLYDVHEWHGNTPFITSDFDFVRLGLVFYYRKNMAACGSSAEELERAKRRTTGSAL